MRIPARHLTCVAPARTEGLLALCALDPVGAVALAHQLCRWDRWGNGDVVVLGPDVLGVQGSGQGEHVVDEHPHAVQLLQRQVGGGGHVLRVVGVHQLQVAAHNGDGGAQLVADVVGQAPLRLHRPLHPAHHPVEGGGQRRQVVPAAHGHPLGEVALVNGLRGLAQLTNGAQQASDGDPGQHRHRGQARGSGQGVQGHGLA
mgnify:CR=1 FL=1